MFPIHSISGRVLGFGGRTLITDKKIAKYFNSPESIIYNKSEILYGLFFAKSDIIKYDQCFLCEGYTDVISMHQAGVTNVVASSGTSLTKEQIKLIKRYTQNITILYDGDAAGIKASFRGIDLILEEGMNVKVLLFPDGDDPDSYSKKVSTTELTDFIKANTQDFVRFKTAMLMKEGSNDPLQLAQMIREIVHSIALIPDPITRSVYVKDIGKEFGIDEALILNELNKTRKTQLAKENNEPQIATNPALTDTFVQPIPQAQTATKVKPAFPFEEFDVLRILVKYGQLAVKTEHLDEQGVSHQIEVSVTELICHELEKDGLQLSHPLFQRIFEHIKQGLENKTIYKTSYWWKHPDQEIVQWVSSIETDSHELSPQWLSKYHVETNSEVDKLKAAVMGSVYAFKQAHISNRIADIRLKLADIDPTEHEKMTDLLMEQLLLERVKMAISQKIGRTITPQ
jgi:DNA primase